MTIVDSVNAGPQVIPLWPSGAPGSEGWTQQERGIGLAARRFEGRAQRVSADSDGLFPRSEDRDRDPRSSSARAARSTSWLTSMKASR